MRNLILIMCLLTFPLFTCFAQTPLDSNHVEISPAVIRVGKNIAYEGDDGQLHLSKAEFVPPFTTGIDYQCETTKLKVYLRPPDTSSWPIQLKYRDKTLPMKLAGLVYYNPDTDAVRIVAGPNHSSWEPLPDDNRVWSPEVFPGVNFICQIYYEGWLPRFIINSAESLPASQDGETYFGVLIELDLTPLSPYRMIVELGEILRDVYQGSDTSNMSGTINQITPTLKTGETTRQRRIRIVLPENGAYKPWFTFDDDKIFDCSAKEFEKRLHPLRMVKRMEEKDYYLELIPLSWLKDAVYPVTFGTGITAGANPNPDEVFLAGNTYVIEGMYNVKSLTSLGASDTQVFVKFVPDNYSQIMIAKSGGLGAQVKNTIFTSLLDNHSARGEKIDPSLFGLSSRDPAAGDYRYALQAIKGNNRFLQNCQIYYAHTGITNADIDAEPLELKNVLIENCASAGAVLTHWGTFVNNTIRNCNQGVVAGDSSAGEVLNSIFADNQTLGSGKLPPGSSNNVWCGNGKDTEDGQYGENSLTETDGLSNPFTSGAKGDCYIRDDLVDKDGNTLDLSNIGFSYP